MIKKDKNESFKHFYAKKLLASWLRDAARSPSEHAFGGDMAKIGDLSWTPIESPWPFFGVYDEYTVDTECRDGNLWSSRGWPRVANGTPKHCPRVHEVQDGREIYVADILVEGAGGASYIFEIVHKSSASCSKSLFYSYFKNAEILYVNADWVLGQTEAPSSIITMTECEADVYAGRHRQREEGSRAYRNRPSRPSRKGYYTTAWGSMAKRKDMLT